MTIDQNILEAVCGQHPAKTMSFDALYQGLMDGVQNGDIYVNRNSTGELEIFNYTPECQFDKRWNVFSLISRGLILCPGKKEVIATPFPKFSNYLEFGAWLPNCGFSVANKYDGSLGIIFRFRGDWQVATRGSFSSEQAIWAKNWLDNNIQKNKLFPGDTYLAEIIYAENRIVVPYDYEGLVLLSVYDNQGYEIDFGEAQSLGKEAGFLPCKQFHYSRIDDLLAVAETLSANEEGFVVRFENGYRVKIKGKEYLAIHKIKSSLTPLSVWEAMMLGLDIRSTMKMLPDEFFAEYEALADTFSAKFEQKIEEIKKVYEETKHLTDKELGLLKHPLGPFLFSSRKKNLLEEVHQPSKARRSVFETFRPTNNVMQDT